MAKKHDTYRRIPSVIWLESVDSTNNECKRNISDMDNLSVLSARTQTDGRGQHENTWSSAPGENLTFSIVLKFQSPTWNVEGQEPMQAYDQSVISEITSLSVVELLSSHGIHAKIKRPNDIYVDGKKICGMLIENAVRGEWMTYSIIGIGLNVNQRNFDVSLPDATSMALLSSENDAIYNLEVLLEEFMEIFRQYLDRYCNIRSGYGRLHRLYCAQLMSL
jgi:BirA family biotin operon repressor/biotin-[acetyl-CoA-carboxylase] ligase